MCLSILIVNTTLRLSPKFSGGTFATHTNNSPLPPAWCTIPWNCHPSAFCIGIRSQQLCDFCCRASDGFFWISWVCLIKEADPLGEWNEDSPVGFLVFGQLRPFSFTFRRGVFSGWRREGERCAWSAFEYERGTAESQILHPGACSEIR